MALVLLAACHEQKRPAPTESVNVDPVSSPSAEFAADFGSVAMDPLDLTDVLRPPDFSEEDDQLWRTLMELASEQERKAKSLPTPPSDCDTYEIHLWVDAGTAVMHRVFGIAHVGICREREQLTEPEIDAMRAYLMSRIEKDPDGEGHFCWIGRTKNFVPEALSIWLGEREARVRGLQTVVPRLRVLDYRCDLVDAEFRPKIR